jgi:formate hydrogenlyase subunit 6/NADH:ubiquinone oxidoreductase subunit I
VGNSIQADAGTPVSSSLHQTARRLSPSDLATVFGNLEQAGYTLIGPKVSEGIITYDRLSHPDDLPRGVTDSQKPAGYQLNRSDKPHYFSYAVGPHTFKRFTFPPRHALWSITRDGGDLKLEDSRPPDQKLAFIGIRSCEIAALSIQDRVFDNDQFSDHHYKARRKDNFILAVNCTHPADTCFCVSTDTGPAARDQFDLSLTEVCTSKKHYFVLQVGSELGASMLAGIEMVEATESETSKARSLLDQGAAHMQRSLPIDGLKELLYENAESPHWDEVGKRCLACTSCTMVCPTCFCSTVEDSTNLSGSEATRTRVWDSCFNEDYSYIHGGSVRISSSARYRQWITHKLATWQDQFGSLGCVGCGRCITWCPSSIDLTEEIKTLREKQTDSQKTLVKE